MLSQEGEGSRKEEGEGGGREGGGAKREEFCLGRVLGYGAILK